MTKKPYRLRSDGRMFNTIFVTYQLINFTVIYSWEYNHNTYFNLDVLPIDDIGKSYLACSVSLHFLFIIHSKRRYNERYQLYR
jgi:hypothetical protein